MMVRCNIWRQLKINIISGVSLHGKGIFCEVVASFSCRPIKRTVRPSMCERRLALQCCSAAFLLCRTDAFRSTTSSLYFCSFFLSVSYVTEVYPWVHAVFLRETHSIVLLPGFNLLPYPYIFLSMTVIF